LGLDLNEREEESALMVRVGQGDAAAYQVLSDKHLRSIMNYAFRFLTNRTDAEDVVQETFLRLWTHANEWKPQMRLSAWLHRIAHNLCIDRLRRRSEPNSEQVERAQESEGPGSLVARKQVAQLVEQAVEALPERQRAAVVLAHYQGLTNIEAAEIMQISVDALESLLARARSALRDKLSALADEAKGDGYEG
jgi:RNA polymerase sigma-70 factor, ECF subfamily